jgi:ribonuclease-3
LGDSVLGLVVSEALLTSSHGLNEGEMSRVRAAIVCESNLARMARVKLNLGDALVIGGSEKATGGEDKTSLLADALEAVLGAVFCDGGWESARMITQALFSDELNCDLRRFLVGDAKTQLQELTQAKLRLTPTYDVVDEVGPAHKKSFEVAVKIGDEVWGKGRGVSKKDAAQAAARLALSRLVEVSP